MVMAVPAHDQRDFEFAKKYKIPIKVVIQPKDKNVDAKTMKEAFVDEGILINSDKFDGMNNKDAIEKITNHLESKKLGKKTTNYKIRDWLISRQRYWGTPIPMIYCKKCGIVPVPESELPVLLPEKVKFGKGNPLATNKEFVNVKCPKCKGNAKRETDTMDTFFDSSWYFLRYCDNKNNKAPFEKKKIEYWMPVNQYIGGAEHACMHLIYARFFTKALRDLGFVRLNEPFPKLFNQGMLHASDGNKMSKSLGNVVNPIDMINKYSADSLRLNLMSLAAPDNDSIWNENGMESSIRFISKVAEFFKKVKKGKSSAKVENKLNKGIKEISKDIENFNYNLAIIKIRELFDSLEQEINKKDAESFLKLLHPFCPHITEELWHKLGNKSFISIEKWPVADESKINPELEKQEQAVEQLIGDIQNIIKMLKERQNKETNKVFVYTLPNELKIYSEAKDAVAKRTERKVEIFAVNDKKKHDPQGKAGKARLGKPAIYLE
jgi:leucyl-tRNA synthetase